MYTHPLLTIVLCVSCVSYASVYISSVYNTFVITAIIVQGIYTNSIYRLSHVPRYDYAWWGQSELLDGCVKLLTIELSCTSHCAIVKTRQFVKTQLRFSTHVPVSSVLYKYVYMIKINEPQLPLLQTAILHVYHDVGNHPMRRTRF